jgi:hypothetical protein
VGVAALLVVGGMMLLGIPGALFAVLAEIVVAPLKGMPIGSIVSGDRAWPAAIMMTLVVPPAIPVVHGLVRWRKPAWNAWPQLLSIVVGTYLWSVIALLVMAS